MRLKGCYQMHIALELQLSSRKRLECRTLQNRRTGGLVSAKTDKSGRTLQSSSSSLSNDRMFLVVRQTWWSPMQPLLSLAGMPKAERKEFEIS